MADQIDVSGFIYQTRGTQRLNVVTDEFVNFYEISKDDHVPTLTNVCYNFMDCT